MTKLMTISGCVVDAEPCAVRGMLDSGMFSFCEDETLPVAAPAAVAPEEETPEEPEAFDFDAFSEERDGDAGAEDLGALTNAELRHMAEGMGIAVPSKANKAKIIAPIEAEG